MKVREPALSGLAIHTGEVPCRSEEVAVSQKKRTGQHLPATTLCVELELAWCSPVMHRTPPFTTSLIAALWVKQDIRLDDD